MTDFKTVCTCQYQTVMQKNGQVVLIRKNEVKCPQHGSKATEA